MRLYQLLGGVSFIDGKKLQDMEITSLAADSRKAAPGGLFVCLRGMSRDGHDYIGQAVSAGASAVLCEAVPANAPENVRYIVCEDTRTALAKVCANFFNNPQKELSMLGVTGTKGKTSVTYYISAVMNGAGRKTGLIGTTGVFLGNETIDIPFETSSTPDILDLYKILAEMRGRGAESAVMEATSHGLHQRRMEGIRFKIGVFTNITHEHLDYHGTFENYIRAKALLFEQCDMAVANRDAQHTEAVLANTRIPVRYFGIGGGGNGCFAENVRLLQDGVEFEVCINGKKQPFRLNIPGKFTVYNALAAIAAACEMGIPAEAIAEGFKRIKGVPGRFENVENNRGITVIVDYAHTADSLENIISSVREFTKGKVITLFGCGGDRDRAKRPEMGKAAGKLSDFVILTSDNPRSENPGDIAAEILPGVLAENARYTIETDRAKAIELAINTARPGDSVIIAGKGHEPYMEFENRRRVPFSDIAEARRVLEG